MKRTEIIRQCVLAAITIVFFTIVFFGCSFSQKSVELTEDQIENIVRRSYQYVAMYNPRIPQ